MCIHNHFLFAKIFTLEQKLKRCSAIQYTDKKLQFSCRTPSQHKKNLNFFLKKSSSAFLTALF